MQGPSRKSCVVVAIVFLCAWWVSAPGVCRQEIWDLHPFADRHRWPWGVTCAGQQMLKYTISFLQDPQNKDKKNKSQKERRQHKNKNKRDEAEGGMQK